MDETKCLECQSNDVEKIGSYQEKRSGNFGGDALGEMFQCRVCEHKWNEELT